MCGIVGVLTYREGAGGSRESILRAMELMARRGPDASGLWTDDEACMLGFRRLSILDLSAAGNQPMLSRDGRYALVFNGELYNFREIGKTLGARGVTFRSTGDAEVVLYALAEFGVKVLEQFNGMFGLAFYDTLERRLLLARDHAGIKPLYVLRDREGVLFASQYDQILSHPWARTHGVNDAALSMYLHLGYLPPPYALIDASSTLEPGTWMSFTADRTEQQGRFFEFPRFRRPEISGHAAIEAVDAAITSAVRRQMVSDVPVGVFLSGGIDSPLVAAKMQSVIGTQSAIPAFTLGTRSDATDESPDARRYAEALGLRHVVRHIGSNDVLGLLDDVVAAFSEPHDDYSIFPTLVVSRLAREHVTVVLSGDGGDDVFWGYPGRMIEPLRQPRNPTGAPPNVGAAQLRAHRFVSKRWLEALFPQIPALPGDFPLYAFEGGSVDEVAQWLRWNEYSGHLVRVLQKVDRASMHSSLEVRVPLLDREVLDVAMRVDWQGCVDVQRNVGKLPLRSALARHVTFQTIPKRGFTVPMSTWLRGPLRPVFADLVLSRRDMLGLPINQAALRRLYRTHAMHIERSPWPMWRLLSLALWEARHYHPGPRHG
ncbi:MAG: asparagine synthase (glutamine-hydrolyzing) [Gemmatimonadota bacterium]|nr:asparagine synthase (glutamine-hydrolyzing) [Gemmatimonadota bacterium]